MTTTNDSTTTGYQHIVPSPEYQKRLDEEAKIRGFAWEGTLYVVTDEEEREVNGPPAVD